MPITKLLISYALTFAVFLLIDMAWLGFIAKGLYKKYLGGFLSEQVNWTAAIVFYLLFVVGVFIFAIIPSVETGIPHEINLGGVANPQFVAPGFLGFVILVRVSDICGNLSIHTFCRSAL